MRRGGEEISNKIQTKGNSEETEKQARLKSVETLLNGGGGKVIPESYLLKTIHLVL